VTHSLTIFCNKITNHNNGQHDVDKTCLCLQRQLTDGNESNPKSDAVFCQTSRKGMYVRSISENGFFSFPPPLPPQLHTDSLQNGEETLLLLFFPLQIPFFAVIHRFCSWLSSVTQSHHALGHENTYISLTLLPQLSYRARRGTSPCLAAGH